MRRCCIGLLFLAGCAAPPTSRSFETDCCGVNIQIELRPVSPWKFPWRRVGYTVLVKNTTQEGRVVIITNGIDGEPWRSGYNWDVHLFPNETNGFIEVQCPSDVFRFEVDTDKYRYIDAVTIDMGGWP